MDNYDVLVIGGGPGGYSFGISAAKKGLKVALFEKEKLGGACLNVGCIPTKYLLDKAGAMEKVRSLSAQGIFRNAGNFSFGRIRQGKNTATDKLVGGVKGLLKKSGVTLVSGEASLVSGCVVRCGGKEYRGRQVVIATGSVPSMLPIPGAEYALDSTGILDLPVLPRRMAVIGGGVIGLELASAFAAFGTEVTVVELLPALMPGEQPEAVRLVAAALKKQGIRLLTGAKLLRIQKGAGGLTAHYEQNGKEAWVEADTVLMASGRKANLRGIDAAALGLALDKGGCIRTDECQRTNLEGVYAIGDVGGGYQLAHAAYAEGEAALAHMLGKPWDAAFPIPKCIYTLPPFATVGLTTEAAAQAGYQPVLGSFSYGANGMALAEGASGAVFAVMDRETERTLGFTVVGDHASELIAFGALAVSQGLTAAQWEQMVVAHPSLSEMMREAALDPFGLAVHKG